MYKVCHVIWFRLHFWRYVVLLFTPCWQYYKFNGLLLFCLIIGQKKKQSWNFISFELNERITSRPFYVLTLLFPQFVRVCISRRYKRMVNLRQTQKIVPVADIMFRIERKQTVPMVVINRCQIVNSPTIVADIKLVRKYFYDDKVGSRVV